MANNANTAKRKPLTKTDLLNSLADKSGLSRKEVSSVLDGLTEVVRSELGKKGPGTFTIPGLAKIVRVYKPAVKGGGTKPNPFKPGETIQIKAKPARNVVKVRPLKALKEMV